VQTPDEQTEDDPNWIIGPGARNPLETWIVVPGVKPLEGMPSPSPIRCVLLGNIQVEGIMIGFAPVAGNRIIVGGGLVIPDHGLAVHVMLVPVVPGRPRASITPPPEGRIPPAGLRIVCSTEQMFVPVLPNALASMKSDEFVVVPDEL
jgi:hypothetical protein